MSLLAILCLLPSIVNAIYPVNRQLDDSNPEGIAGVDYPVYRSVPRHLGFQCNHRAAGFYADPETQCQVWHLCDLHGRKHSFLCPNMTMFNQLIRGCDWWYNVDCDASVDLYSNNDDLFKDNRVDAFGNRRSPDRPNPTSRHHSDDRTWVEAITATQPPPPPPPPRPVPTAPPQQRPQQRVTFQVIRRPAVTQPPATEPPPPPPSQFSFADPPRQDLSSSDIPEEPPTSWTVHFIATSPPAIRGGIRPIPLDNSWRLGQDQERAFPNNPPVPPSPTFPPEDNTFGGTRRTPHIVESSSPLPPFSPSSPRFSRPPPPPPPPPTQLPSETPSARISSLAFGARTPTAWSSSSNWPDDIPQVDNAVSSQAPFSPVSKASFAPSPNSFAPSSNSRPISSINPFSPTVVHTRPSFPPSFSAPASFSPASFSPASNPGFSHSTQVDQGTPQLAFGRRTSPRLDTPPPASVHHEPQEPETSSTAPIPQRRLPPASSTWWESSTSFPNTLPPASSHFSSASSRFSPSLIPTASPTWSWTSRSVSPAIDNNRLDQTDTLSHSPQEFDDDQPADPEESDIFKTEVQTTEFFRTRGEENEVTTYHPPRLVPSSIATDIEETTDPPTTHIPATRTSRRRIIRTTTPVEVTTFRPITITTTTTTPAPPPPPPPPKKPDAPVALAPEPSIPLVFGARLRPKKVFQADNAVADSQIHVSTVQSPITKSETNVHLVPVVNAEGASSETTK